MDSVAEPEAPPIAIQQGEVAFDPPRVDLLPLRFRSDRFVVADDFELCVEFEAAVPPLIEIDVAVANRAKPFSRFALDREFELAGRQQLEALE